MYDISEITKRIDIAKQLNEKPKQFTVSSSNWESVLVRMIANWFEADSRVFWFLNRERLMVFNVDVYQGANMILTSWNQRLAYWDIVNINKSLYSTVEKEDAPIRILKDLFLKLDTNG